MSWRSLALLLCAASPLAPQASEVDRVLDAWEAKAKSLTSFTCRFKQEKKVSFMRRPLVSSGTMKFRAFPDSKLLWKTEQPSPSFLSVDAVEVRIYTPEFKTVEIYPLGAKSPGAPGGQGEKSGGASGSNNAGSGLAGAFPGFSGDLAKLREPYAAELLPTPEGGDAKHKRLRLTPRTDELKKEVVAIEITLDEQLLVQLWRIVRANGDELLLTLSDFVANAKVSDADLKFDVPADVKVVRPLGPGGEGGGP